MSENAKEIRSTTNLNSSENISASDAPKCDNCEKVPSEFTCPQCDENFCGLCDIKRHSEGKPREHKRGPYLKVPSRFCSSHRDPLTVFCNTCTKPICTQCQMTGEHKSHSCMPLKLAVEEVKVTLTQTMEEVRAYMEKTEAEIERQEMELKKTKEAFAMAGKILEDTKELISKSELDSYLFISMYSEFKISIQFLRLSEKQSRTETSPVTQVWYYKDPEGNLQGPFSNEQMQVWYEGEFLTSDLVIAKVAPDAPEPTEFTTLDKLTTGGANPFTELNKVETENQEEEEEEVDWYYKDPEQNVQGPFASEQMEEWFQNGFFSLTLEIAKTVFDGPKPTKFFLLEKLMRRGVTPFIRSNKMETETKRLQGGGAFVESGTTKSVGDTHTKHAKKNQKLKQLIVNSKPLTPSSETKDEWYYIGENGIYEGPYLSVDMKN